MRYFFIPYLFGFFLPIFSYLAYTFSKFFKTRKQKHEDYATLPKYKNLVAKIDALLTKLMPYYAQLSKSGKQKFTSRLIFLILEKKFEAREGATLTIEKQILILGALVQLTFGLKKFALPKFGRIAIYPSIFYSSIVKRNVKGLTFNIGIILLSWFDTYKGFHDDSDNLNLALHEWAHAFVIDHKNSDIHWMYSTLNRHLNKMDGFYRELKKYQEEHSYLREYSLTNTHEFFAVCIEHFFETPEEFYSKHKDIFYVLCRLLNQNPLNKDIDYKLA